MSMGENGIGHWKELIGKLVCCQPEEFCRSALKVG